MDTLNLYTSDFPEEHKVRDIDIISLYHESKFETLNEVIVCKNANGKVTATFGQNRWNLLPFTRTKNKNSLDFNEWNNSPKLQLTMKLIAFGWLFNKSPQRRKALKLSGMISRLDNFKVACRFLSDNNLDSLKELNNPNIWAQLEYYLQRKNYSQDTIGKVFTAINATITLEPWHKLKLGIAPIKSTSRAKELSDKQQQQTLVIPERLCNNIYGKAIEIVNAALPHKQLIADIEMALQANYLEGKRILEEKMQRSYSYSFICANGEADSQKLAATIRGNQPLEPKSIISTLNEKITDIQLNNGTDFRRYLGQLITACYIICGGFSGMRDSELDKLTPNSYYKDTFDGRDYHMLQSHTFKLGEKRETWVTASSSEQAIELASKITKHWRKEVEYPNEKYVNSIWVNQSARSKLPVLISDWNDRLKRFCKHFDLVITEEDYQTCIKENPLSLERVNQSIKVGLPWPLATHQFRRTLAFYCIKHRLGTAVALKQQFKHLYLSMTEWYTNGGKLAGLRDLKVDTKIQQALEEINAETTANKIFKQWHSDETLSGAHGKAIMKMRGDVPTIYSSWDVIYKAVKDGKLTLHGSMHSYCKSGYDCDMDGVVAPQFCVDCGSGSSIIDEQQAKWWQKKHRSLVAYMESGEEISVSEQSHYITQVRAAEKVMADFDMSFTPFEPDLKAANI
ncbi:hypothetical protein [Vibrio crassostreae]|uniref:hypothetical protein n=1 Tax=Vibrio crassostreae TaxID=246167 RepID=UPI001B30EAE4|nr:hypothetical protein [Vibrio crassostreae]CAK3866688.1 Integrase [Vibrio crassostreae]